MNTIRQTRFFTHYYSQLQGLRAVPISLYLLALTLWANTQTGPARDLTFPLLAGLGFAIFYILVDQYYHRVYGKIKRSLNQAEILLQAAGMALALAAFVVDTRDVIRISLLGLVFAATFAYTGWRFFPPTSLAFAIHMVMAVLLVLLSLSPLVGVAAWWSFLGLKHSLLAFTFLFGVFGVLDGFLLHLFFIRSLPVSQEAA